MKAIGSAVCGMVLALAAGCVDGGRTDEASLALTGSGSGSSTGSGSGAATVFHSTWNGRMANVGTSNGIDSYSVDAYEYTGASTRVVFLDFWFSGPDPSSQVCYTYSDGWGTYTYCYYTAFINEYGWGVIPSSDFQIDPNSAHLNVTTDASYFISKCTWSWVDWSYNCTTGGSETFDLRWNNNHQFSSESNGTTRMTSGVFSIQTEGAYSQTSADTNGTAFGTTLSAVPGSLSDSRSTNVTRDVLQSH